MAKCLAECLADAWPRLGPCRSAWPRCFSEACGRVVRPTCLVKVLGRRHQKGFFLPSRARDVLLAARKAFSVTSCWRRAFRYQKGPSLSNRARDFFLATKRALAEARGRIARPTCLAKVLGRRALDEMLTKKLKVENLGC